MKTGWKVLIGAVVVIPLLAYVAGSLAEAEPTPQPHTPILLDQPSETTSRPPASRPQAPDRPATVPADPDDLDDPGDDLGRDDDSDDRDDDDGVAERDGPDDD